MECMTPRRARSIRHDTATTPRTKDSCSEPSTTHSSKDPDNALPDDRLPRMHLSTPKHNFELLASRTISQALSDDSRAAKPLPSPLDTVDSSLYPRFPRFSLTTESRFPDLSTDDVTSTKISLDEEGMVASRRPSNTSDSRSSRRQKLWIALHRAVSSPTFGIRRLGDRIRRVPTIMLSGGNSKRLDAEGSENQVQVVASDTGKNMSTGRSRLSSMSPKLLPKTEAHNQPSGIPAKVDDPPTHKLSYMPEDQTSDSEIVVSPGRHRGRTLFGVPSHTTLSPAGSALRYASRPSVTTVDSFHTACEQLPQSSPAFPGRASGWLNTPNSGLPRAVSLGSIDELRSNSFPSQQRVLGVPNIPCRRSSLPGFTRSTPAQRPRTLSVCDVDDLTSLNHLRRDPMFVDIQEGHQVDFVFPTSSDGHTRSVSLPKSFIGPKAHSYRSLRQNDSTPLQVRSSSIRSGLEEARGTTKIPLFVPSHIIKPVTGMLPIPERQSSRLFPDAALRVGDAAQDEQIKGQENRSKETLSEASDWSTTVQFEAPKQEIFQSKSNMMQGSGLEVGAFEVESLDGSLCGSLRTHHHGMRILQSCCAYFHRARQLRMPGSSDDVRNL